MEFFTLIFFSVEGQEGKVSNS